MKKYINIIDPDKLMDFYPEDLKAGFDNSLPYPMFMEKYGSHVEVRLVDPDTYNNSEKTFVLWSTIQPYDQIIKHKAIWNNLSTTLKDAILSGTLYILYDTCTENNVTFRDDLEYFINEYNVPRNKIKWFTGAISDTGDIESFCPNIFEMYTRENSTNRLLSDIFSFRRRIAKFLCVQGKARSHRIALLLLLMDNDELDDGFISMWAYDGNDLIYRQDRVEYAMDELRRYVSDNTYKKMEQRYTELLSMLPLYVDIDPFEKRNNAMISHLSPSHSSIYNTSYYSIISETDFFNDEACFITEKTYKAISMNHPFIIFGRPGMLSALRQLGYKTFSPHIDESYDLELDNEKRMFLMINEIKRLNSLSHNEWNELYTKLSPAIRHNYNRFYNRHLYVEMNPSILSFIDKYTYNESQDIT